MPDDDPDNAALHRAVRSIVRQELQLSEGRIEARITAITDDMRSEIRALRRMDEAIDARLTLTSAAVDRTTALNQGMIQSGVQQALAQMFSPTRILLGVGLLMGTVTGAIALVDQFRTWM